MVQITPKGVEAPLIEFDIIGVGKFQLPVLGDAGVPFGITNAFGLFEDATKSGDDRQKIAAWSYLIQALSDSFPAAVRVLGRLGNEDVGTVFEEWGAQSKDYDPKAESSPL